MNKLLSILTIFTLGCFTLNCGGVNKGAESEMPIDGSADSWYSPTEHGPLIFGIGSSAQFDDDTLYHAWSFALTDVATASIWIVPHAQNLDTVMYLYHKNPDDNTWGSYIARNDDYDSNLWSRLDEQLEAGDYRIMIKGYKENLRGQFSVSAICEGPGCPGNNDDDLEPSPDCVEGEYVNMGEGAWSVSQTCLMEIDEVLTSKTITTAGVYVGIDERCDLPHEAKLAWDYFYTYWDNLIGIDEFFYDESEVGFDMFYAKLEQGWRITMHAGGDEDAMYFVFNNESELLAMYQDNQSPDYGFFCNAGEDENNLKVPEDDYCLGNYILNMAPKKNIEEQSGTVIVRHADAHLPLLAYLAVEYYAQQAELAPDKEVSFSYKTWDGHDNKLMEISTFTDENAETVIILGGNDEFDTYIYFIDKVDIEETDFVCTDF
jgi:hypothetical protein